MLERGDLEAQTDDGLTPLHWGVSFNNEPAVVAVLLDRGANPKAQAVERLTPLHIKVRRCAGSN